MKIITMAHGSGGIASQELFNTVFRKYFQDPILAKVDDSADLDLDKGRYCFTTDSFVIHPLFFPGGDIGKLAVCGTVNDLSVNGSRPLYLSCGFIIEEGLDIGILEKVAASMAEWARIAGIRIVAGDTKVVGHGQADGLYINTAGIGLKLKGAKALGIEAVRQGDKIMLTGAIGEHGIAVLSQRQGLEFRHTVRSDCFPLNKCLGELVEKVPGIRFMRDATRGGVATVLNEICQQSKKGIVIEEDKIPVSKDVEAACGLLGLDPLYIANEGRAVVIVGSKRASLALKILKQYAESSSAVVIGEIAERAEGLVLLKTRYGSERILSMLSGEPLPRIC